MQLRWGFGSALLVLILTTVLRGWAVRLPNAAFKTFFTSRAMAQSAGTDIPLIVVYITVPNKEIATKLSSSLVSNKLAACVNQVPGVVSTYMWEGKVETDDEILLIVKTRQSLLDPLTVHVKANHPYTVPEVIALPILGGSESYVKWVAENTLERQNA